MEKYIGTFEGLPNTINLAIDIWLGFLFTFFIASYLLCLLDPVCIPNGLAVEVVILFGYFFHYFFPPNEKTYFLSGPVSTL